MEVRVLSAEDGQMDEWTDERMDGQTDERFVCNVRVGRRIAHTCTRDQLTDLTRTLTYGVTARRCARIAHVALARARVSSCVRAERITTRHAGTGCTRASSPSVSSSARQPIDGEWLSRQLLRLGFRRAAPRRAGEITRDVILEQYEKIVIDRLERTVRRSTP